jgi:hypothetical protein
MSRESVFIGGNCSPSYLLGRSFIETLLHPISKGSEKESSEKGQPFTGKFSRKSAGLDIPHVLLFI